MARMRHEPRGRSAARIDLGLERAFLAVVAIAAVALPSGCGDERLTPVAPAGAPPRGAGDAGEPPPVVVEPNEPTPPAEKVRPCDRPCGEAPGCQAFVGCDATVTPACLYEPLPERTPCATGGLCHDGSCVECLDDYDCEATETSAQGRFRVECIANDCTSTELLPRLDVSYRLEHQRDETCFSHTDICASSFADDGPGQHFNFFLASGQIGSILLPDVPAGTVATSQVVYSAAPIELGFSRVPGDLEWWREQPRNVGGSEYWPCGFRTTGFDASIDWMHEAPVGFMDCHLPRDAGPWYVNVRLTYPPDAGCLNLSYVPGKCAVNILFWLN